MNINQGFYYYFHFVYIHVYLMCMPPMEYIIIIILIIVLPSAIDCFYFHFKRTSPAVSLTHLTLPCSLYQPSYTKTHGPQPIDLVNSITVIVIVIVIVWCSVVMREKYSFNILSNPLTVVASLLNIVAHIYIRHYISLNIGNSLLIMSIFFMQIGSFFNL